MIFLRFLSLLQKNIKSLNITKTNLVGCFKRKLYLSDSRKSMTSRNSIYSVKTYWINEFKKHNINEPTDSIKNIIAHCIHTRNLSHIDILSDTILTNKQIGNITELCKKRLLSMPIQYIIGEWDFCGITLKMSPPVFIPRPETEQLVNLVIFEIQKQNYDCNNILDLCCGSGAISLAILNRVKKVKCVAVDKNSDACKLTKENAKILSLDDCIEIIESDLENLSKNTCFKKYTKFDLVVSNPPYVWSENIKYLQPEILRYEDIDALNGGADGLDVIKEILYLSSFILNSNRKLFLEVDSTHGELIEQYLQENSYLGLTLLTKHLDCFGVYRFIEIIKNN